MDYVLALFTIVCLRLCMIEKVIYKTKLDEYIYFVGLGPKPQSWRNADLRAGIM